MLPKPHRHAVFSLPKRLRPFFKFKRKLCRILYRAAWNAWREVVCIDSSIGNTGGNGSGGCAGAVLALHSAGDQLNWHPHIHGLMLDGCVDQDGAFRQAPEIDTARLESEFSNRVLNALIAEELIEEDAATAIASQEHTGFNSWVSEPIAADDADRRRFVARYLKRCPSSLERLELIDHGLGATIRVTKKLDDGEKVHDFSPLEFLAEVSMHIPDIWEQTTHYYGYYSARTRGVERAAKEAAVQTPKPQQHYLAESLETPKRPVSQQWAIWIKQVYEVDPLVCPRCGGQMKIIAFLHDSNVIIDICASLGLQPWRAPPKISNPAIDTFCYDQTCGEQVEPSLE